MIPSRTDSIVAMPSTAPAAPSMCPVIDLVAVTTGWSPIAPADGVRLGDVADRGRRGVRVHVADVRRVRSAERSALAIARADPSPSGSGAVMW